MARVGAALEQGGAGRQINCNRLLKKLQMLFVEERNEA
jgi:hypothetical protein